MMRTLIIFLSLSLQTICVFCQNSDLISKNELIGFWQKDTNEVTSMYLDVYNFYPNNRFIFKPNAYNGLNSIIEIRGTFKLTRKSIIFSPDSVTECTGGTLERSHFTTLSDSWSFENCHLKKIKIKSNPQEATIIKAYDEKNKDYYILIDDRKFYKIDE